MSNVTFRRGSAKSAEWVLSFGSMYEKHKRFVDAYLVLGNAQNAAIEAGYAENRARRTGSELLKRPDVAAAIAKAQAERSERMGYDADKAVEMTAAVYERAMEGEVKFHGGKPVRLHGELVREPNLTAAVTAVNTLVRVLGIGQPRQVEHTGEVVYTLRVDPRPAALESGVVDVDVVEELEGDESDGMDDAPVWA